MTNQALFWDSFTSPIGLIRLVADEQGLRRVCFEKDAHPRAVDSEGIRSPQILANARQQLDEYFAGDRRQFSLPLSLPPDGTPFQREVWLSLASIKFGDTRSYAGLAHSLGRPGASRAVGGANARNALPIVLPCHRVIGADGSLTGFAGGIEVKRWLLAFEQQVVAANH